MLCRISIPYKVYFGIILCILYLAPLSYCKSFIKPKAQVAYADSQAEITCLSEVPPFWTRQRGEKFEHDKMVPYDGRMETIALKYLNPHDSGTYSCAGHLNSRDFVLSSKLYVGGKYSFCL